MSEWNGWRVVVLFVLLVFLEAPLWLTLKWRHRRQSTRRYSQRTEHSGLLDIRLDGFHPEQVDLFAHNEL